MHQGLRRPQRALSEKRWHSLAVAMRVAVQMMAFGLYKNGTSSYFKVPWNRLDFAVVRAARTVFSALAAV